MIFIVGGIVVVALVVGIIYFVTKKDDKSSTSDRPSRTTAVKDRDKDTKDEDDKDDGKSTSKDGAKACARALDLFEEVENRGQELDELDDDVSVAEGKKVLGGYLDEAIGPMLDEMINVIDAARSTKGASAVVKSQADEYLDVLDGARDAVSEASKELSKAKTEEEVMMASFGLMEAFAGLESLDDDSYAELIDAVAGMGDDCADLVAMLDQD